MGKTKKRKNGQKIDKNRQNGQKKDKNGQKIG